MWLVLVLVLVLLLMLLLMLLLRLHHIVGYVHRKLPDSRGDVNSRLTYSSRKLGSRTHVIGSHLLMLTLFVGPIVIRGNIYGHLHHIDNIHDVTFHHKAQSKRTHGHSSRRAQRLVVQNCNSRIHRFILE